MDSVSYFQRFNTDTLQKGLGQTSVCAETNDFQYVLNMAIQSRAHVIVLPSNRKKWYIKGLPGKCTKTFEEIKQDILTNISKDDYRTNSTLYLLNY